jgi:accessory secretory protein Asp1
MVGRMTEEERSFKVVVRSSPEQSSQLPSFYTSLVWTHYPEEMALIDERGLDSVGENGLEDVFLEDFKAKVFFVKALLESFEVESFVNDEKLFKILHETRLVIDLGAKPDLFTQIAGISSGLPQINRVETDYVLAQKNGSLITELQELPGVLAYYLDSLRTWQEARVHSVQQMKRFSGQALSRKVRDLFKGEANG